MQVVAQYCRSCLSKNKLATFCDMDFGQQWLPIKKPTVASWICFTLKTDTGQKNLYTLWVGLGPGEPGGRIKHIFFSTELHLKNVYYLFSACSNHTDIVIVDWLKDCLSDYTLI